MNSLTQIQKFGAGNANTRETFNAPEILDKILIDQGLFVERVKGSYSFSHLTFQEYLTANYIVGNPRSIQGLVNQHLHDQQVARDILTHCWTDARGRRFACGDGRQKPLSSINSDGTQIASLRMGKTEDGHYR